jgi:broad specificity phosphatase PhoE
MEEDFSDILDMLGMQGHSGVGAPDVRNIVLIRHGATALNNKDRNVDKIRGWSNVPLTQEGREQATKLGVDLRGKGLDGMASSDLDRAHETARIASSLSGVPLTHVTDSFRPWNVGELTGKLSSHACPILEDYVEKMPDQPVPGGESFNDFKGRFLAGLASTLAQRDGKLGVVTHHRGDRLLSAWEKKGFPPDGSLDLPTFHSHGEATGGMRDMEIPMDRLAQVVRGGGSA